MSWTPPSDTPEVDYEVTFTDKGTGVSKDVRIVNGNRVKDQSAWKRIGAWHLNADEEEVEVEYKRRWWQ